MFNIILRGLWGALGHNNIYIYTYTFGKVVDKGAQILKEQGPTRHRPMAHPVVFRYLSYSTTLAEHAVHRLRRCTAFG